MRRRSGEAVTLALRYGFRCCARLDKRAALMWHKAREILVSQRTQFAESFLRRGRGATTEVGVIAREVPRQLPRLRLIEACDETSRFEVLRWPAPLVAYA